MHIKLERKHLVIFFSLSLRLAFSLSLSELDVVRTDCAWVVMNFSQWETEKNDFWSSFSRTLRCALSLFLLLLLLLVYLFLRLSLLLYYLLLLCCQSRIDILSITNTTTRTGLTVHIMENCLTIFYISWSFGQVGRDVSDNIPTCIR